MDLLELFGYAASVLVALSLTMSSIVRLRWVNMTGAAMFTVYGLMIDAMPVALLNGFIVFANLWHLWGIYRRPQRLRLVQSRVSDPLVEHWMSHFEKDIDRYFPRLKLEEEDGRDCAVMLRDAEPVGLLIGRQLNGEYEVDLDYAFPPYRDFKTGHYLYHRSGYFSRRGIQHIRTRSRSERHQAYLKKMGFERAAGTEDEFVYQIRSA